MPIAAPPGQRPDSTWWKKSSSRRLNNAGVSRTIADGLRVQQLGALTWPHIQAYVDDIVTVSEDEIKDAMRQLAWNAKLVVEPSGAVTFAAWLHHRHQLPVAKFNVAVISGGNVEPSQFLEIVGG